MNVFVLFYVRRCSIHFLLLCLVQQHVFKSLENDPVFARQPGEDISVEKKRELNFLRYWLFA